MAIKIIFFCQEWRYPQKTKQTTNIMDTRTNNKKRSGQANLLISFSQKCLKQEKGEICKFDCSKKRLLNISVTCFYLVRRFIKLAAYLSMRTLLKKHGNSVNSSLGYCFSRIFVVSAYVEENTNLIHISLHTPIPE